MSLRTFQKVISASSFAAKSHNFIFANYGRTFSPASLFFNPKDENLQPGHSHDPFTLSILGYELTRQNENLSRALLEINSGKSNNTLKEEITNQINENSKYIDIYTKALILELKTGLFDIPVNACSYAIYILEKNGKPQKELYKSALLPTIKGKQQFLDFEGLSKLINGLVSSNTLDDQVLLKSLLARLNQKIDYLAERQFVGFSSWKLDRFEKSENNRIIANPSELLQLSKEKGVLGSLKHWLRVGYGYLENNILFGIFYRENRVYRQFDQIDEVEEIKALIQDLEKLHQLEPSLNAKELVEKLKKI